MTLADYQLPECGLWLMLLQVGIIQYHNFTCADSGAGVRMLPVSSGFVTISWQPTLSIHRDGLVQHVQEFNSLRILCELCYMCEQHKLTELNWPLTVQLVCQSCW